MRRPMCFAPLFTLAAVTVVAAQQSGPPSQPTFRAATELIAIDATVVDDRGEPIGDLSPEDFNLTIDGSPRRVVSAQFIKQEPAGPVPTLAARRLPFSSNQGAVGGRLLLIVFDLEGIAVGSGRGASAAASRFLDQLSAADRVGVLAFPNGANVDFTTDRERVKQALSRVVGRGSLFTDGRYNIGMAEAFEVDRGDGFATQRVIERECANETTSEGIQICTSAIENQARSAVVIYRQRAADSLRMLRGLLSTFRRIDAPKTVIWISEGLPLEQARAEVGGLSAEAAAARTTIYTLHLDQTIIADASRSRSSPSASEDRQLASDGLETIAGISRGRMFTSIGTGSEVFARIAREMTAYYLLSVEPVAEDRDGKTHRIKVGIGRPGLTVRARREFSLANEAADPVSPEKRVVGILQQPLLATELPLKVATYNLRTPGSPKVKVVLTTEIGRNAVAAQDTAIGYVVLADKGKVVTSAFQTSKAIPIREGEPGPLHATTMVEVPPGSYTVRLAVVDAEGRGGSVEHPFTASLASAAGIELADLLLTPLRPGATHAVRLVADPTIDNEAFGAYLELYAKTSDAGRGTRVSIEVAETDTGPAIAAAQASVTETNKGRLIAQAALPVSMVPPGEYVARAVVTLAGSSTVQARPFRLVRAVPDGEIFKSDLASRVGSFERDQALTPALLHPALARAREIDGGQAPSDTVRLAEHVLSGELQALDAAADGDGTSLLAWFLKGLALYRAGKLEDAARQFRSAVRSSPDFLSGIFYLGACYAAGGRGREAVGAWQTSLISEDTSPEVFQMLVDGYLRLGDTEAAIGLIEEAAAKWPDDYRFVLRAALAKAAAGNPEEAIERLLPWLDRQANDREALDLALRLALSDVAARKPEDAGGSVTRLKAIAARYERAGVPVPPLATRWLAYLAARDQSQ